MENGYTVLVARHGGEALRLLEDPNTVRVAAGPDGAHALAGGAERPLAQPRASPGTTRRTSRWSSSRTEKQIDVEKFIALYDKYQALEKVDAPFDEAAARRLDDLAAEWDDATLRLKDAGVDRGDLAAALSAAGRADIAYSLGDELDD